MLNRSSNALVAPGSLLLALAVTGLGGCLGPNPLFDTGSSSGTSTGGPTTDATMTTLTMTTTVMATTALTTTTTTAGTDGTSTGVDATTAMTTASTTTTTTTATTTTGATSETGALETMMAYGAVEAGCAILPAMDQPIALPNVCEQWYSAGNMNSGAGELGVDLMNESFQSRESRGLLRFPAQPSLVGKTITAVTLTLTVTNQMTAAADQSGAIWASEAFELATLADSVPALVGDAPLSGDLGAVSNGVEVVWDLPASTLSDPNAELFLQIVAASSDEVHYWNDTAPDESLSPRLQVQWE